MLLKIAPKVKVYLSEQDVSFLLKYRYKTFTNRDLDSHEIELAKKLSDKSILVRKKLEANVQYAVNRRISLNLYESKK